MIEFWLAAIDASRPHEIGPLLSWHARLMVFAWAVLAPAGVIAARYFKVLPWQNWPRELDNLTWWRIHRVAQHSTVALTTLAFVFAVLAGPIVSRTGSVVWHHAFGFAVIALAAWQWFGALLRGTKGGPTAPAPDGSLHGDHFDMTLRRRVFEAVHKSGGYAALICACTAIVLGLWQANAPRWMWAALALWLAFLAGLVTALARRGPRVSTYQAIWGPDPDLPGNRDAPAR